MYAAYMKTFSARISARLR